MLFSGNMLQVLFDVYSSMNLMQLLHKQQYSFFNILKKKYSA
uniref:Uncharacterized protein n=1 Tax=Anguilla anguilla TaxID=7936 RepID=A0A0E9QHS8_ANGAN